MIPWFLCFASDCYGHQIWLKSDKPGRKHPNVPRAWSLNQQTATMCFSLPSVLNCLVSQAHFPDANEASGDELTAQGSGPGSAFHTAPVASSEHSSGQISLISLLLHRTLWSAVDNPAESTGVFSLADRPPGGSNRTFWPLLNAKEWDTAQCDVLVSAGFQDRSLSLGEDMPHPVVSWAVWVQLCFLLLCESEQAGSTLSPSQTSPAFLLPRVYGCCLWAAPCKAAGVGVRQPLVWLELAAPGALGTASRICAREFKEHQKWKTLSN